MANLDSVTVSIAALTKGIFMSIFLLNFVETSTSLGRIADFSGTNKISSKVKPSKFKNLSFSIISPPL
ncbi:hypothetical protein ES703_09977 [subsurface metagenome]